MQCLDTATCMERAGPASVTIYAGAIGSNTWPRFEAEENSLLSCYGLVPTYGSHVASIATYAAQNRHNEVEREE